MARRKKQQEPRRREYRTAATIKTGTAVGRAQLWHERIQRAKDMLQIEARGKQREKHIRYIDGSLGLTAQGDQVYFNEALPALEDLIFSAFPKLPPVQVLSKQEGQEELAKQVGALLDATLENNLCRAKQAVIAAEWGEIEWGIGIIKSAWKEEERSENYRPTQNPDYLLPHISAAEQENLVPDSAEVAEGDDDAVHIEVHKGIPELEGHVAVHLKRLGRKGWAYPKCLFVDTARFLYDPDAEEWADRDWETELCDELVSALEDIPGIKNLNPENCPPIDEFDNTGERLKDPGVTFDFEKTRVQVYKIHDRANDSYLILPAEYTEQTKPVLEADWPYGSLDIYHSLVHRPKAGRIHGMATLPLISPILQELARTNASIRRHVRRAANAKMVGPKGVSIEDIAELNNEASPYAPLTDRALALMKEFKPPSVPIETLQHRERCLSELRRMLGSDIIFQGGDTPHEISATETLTRSKTRDVRLSRRKQEISEVLSEIGRNIAMFYHYWAEEELMVRVMGPQGAVPMRLDPKAIPEDLLIKLDIEAIAEDQMIQDMQMAQAFVEVLMTVMPGSVNPLAVVEFLAERMNITNPGRFIAKPGTVPILPAPPGQAGVSPASRTTSPLKISRSA